MAEQQRVETADGGEKHRAEAVDSGQPVTARRFRWALPLALMVVAAETIGLVGLVVTRHRAEARMTVPATEEVPLGRFCYVSRRGAQPGMGAATFQLHVRFLDEVRPLAQARLAARRFRVQQDLEVLLWQASANDFADPALVGLKRQIQEQINQSLGIRAVAEVIVTGLTRTDRPARGAPAASQIPGPSTPIPDRPPHPGDGSDDSQPGRLSTDTR